jgi:Do/DeqQ family serine protease
MPSLAAIQGKTVGLSLPTEPNAIADIVDAVGPAVVKIQTKSVAQSSLNDPFQSDPFFREFFGGSSQSQPRVTQGLGSGFIISSDGYVLTNQHVIDETSEIQVTVMGYDQPFIARVVGSDQDLDLAVLKIDSSKELPYLQFGSSDSIRVGEWVIAIGNPYGLDHTVTVGVISAKSRPVDIQNRHYRNLLQTDASINPGNSGGPLLNLQGQVVGVNTAINAAAQGIGFAIPSGTVQGVIQELIHSGKVAHPWLGVAVGPVTSEMIKTLGMDKPAGAIIKEVVAGSPAKEAGFMVDDVILEFNQTPIKTPDTVVEQVAAAGVGNQAVVKILRQGKTMEIKVTIGKKGAS